MKINIIEWLGMILGDQLAFLVVAFAFLYTFTEPVQELKSHQLVEQTIEQQQQQIMTLENTVNALRLAGKKNSSQRNTPQSKAFVRLFPGNLIVLATETSEPQRVEADQLVRRLRDQQPAQGSAWQVVLSAEPGVAFSRMTELAEELKSQNFAIQFGW